MALDRRRSFRTHTGACPPREKTERPSEQTAGGLGGAVTARDLRAGSRLRRACDPMSAAGWTIVRPGCAAQAVGASNSATIDLALTTGPATSAERPRAAGQHGGTGRKVRPPRGGSVSTVPQSVRPERSYTVRPARESWLLHGQVDARPASAAGVGNLTRGVRTTCRVNGREHVRAGDAVCPLSRPRTARPGTHDAEAHAEACVDGSATLRMQLRPAPAAMARYDWRARPNPYGRSAASGCPPGAANRTSVGHGRISNDGRANRVEREPLERQGDRT